VQSQVAALKAQIQPHFLFNTLHAVTVLIGTDPAGAKRMVARLGDLLRLTLARAQAREVTLESELELVRLYLDIESVRFADRLTVAYDTPAEVLGAAVPDLLLQPLVENAIKHGIATSPGAGRITITARRVDRWLDLEIRNSGRAGARATSGRDGIGHGVTRARLAGLYGADHAFRVVPATDGEGGAVAHVRLPWRDLRAAETRAADESIHV
jgi:two-component system, LytTR family, sensor kinase